MTAAATAPGATSRTDSRRAAAKRNPKTNTAMLISTDAATATNRRIIPNGPTPLPPTMDKAVVPIMASPAVASSSRLRPRALNGFGRLLRGTPHTVFVAYWNACATPRPPYRDPRMPMTSPAGPPPMCFG